MITEDYVNFEIAKLLKEKGFDAECDYLYVDGKLIRTHGCSCNWNDGEMLFADYKNECSAPTLQMAMKWLREVFNLFISIQIHTDGSYIWYVYNTIYDTCKGTDADKESDSLQHSYEEACEAAIKYCLENLI